MGAWIARYLGPEQLGLLSFAIAFVGLFVSFASLGLSRVVVSNIVRIPDRVPKILGTTAILYLISGIAIYPLALVLITYIRPDDIIARTLVAIIGSTMLFKASEISVHLFEAKILSKYNVWIQNGVFLFFTAVKAILILEQASLIDFAWIIMAEVLVAGIILLGVMNKYSLSLTKLRVSNNLAKSLLKDSWPILLSGIFVSIYMKVDQIMLGKMIGNEAVGVYSVASNLSLVWIFIPIFVVASVFPSIIEIQKKSVKHFNARVQQLFDLLTVIAVVIALPITFLSTPIIILIFGEIYRDAGIILAIHIWGTVIYFLGIVSDNANLVQNRQVFVLQRTAIGAILNVALNLYLIPNFGGIGAAFAFVISVIVSTILLDGLQIETRTFFFMKLRAMNPLRLKKFFS
jgi:PST family polysaccharide transporter